MRKFVYENATVYITVPTEEQLENIRKSTKIFVQNMMKEQMKNGNSNQTRTINKK